jgi:hypothetical protein
MCLFRYKPSDHIELFHDLYTPSRHSAEAQEQVHLYIRRKSFVSWTVIPAIRLRFDSPNQLTNYMAQETFLLRQ